MTQKQSESEEAPILVIGAITADISITAESFNQGKMNRGTSSYTLGGVGWNIARNLSALDLPVKLISAVGNDAFGMEALKEADKWGIDTSDVVIKDERSTPTILIATHADGSESLSVKSPNVLDSITRDSLESIRETIHLSKYCILDGSLEPEVLAGIRELLPEATILLDPASEEEADKLVEVFTLADIIKPNQSEAEIWADQKISSNEDAKRAVDSLMKKGAKQIVLPLEDGGAVYNDSNSIRRLKGIQVDPVNTTGAGDAFLSGLIYGLVKDCSLEKAVRMGMAASVMTLQTEEIIHPELSPEALFIQVEEILKEATD
ncbi:carbohydrate kinase family protein [Alkalibacterium pelagium]|uniref:Tagatose-6-phosphate kinase n=1 Tax=Alkalibacterium pelagium TaxID=426702 RepID=A0A1H7IJA6_9LACT|nr:PfkB family carbohydrate kinase [Alkalibacterium pelagium]GEN50108.1 carbohydrate kinase [Alkalibacterium pelagium]SEK62488.1 pseudouridine kinase [Alkalibacterium pelagium]